MCKFHYDYIKNKRDNKSKLLFTENDSLMYEIKSVDVFEDFSSSKEMSDFSNYSTKTKHYDDSNKLVIRKMKEQTKGVAFKKFVRLKSKMYSPFVDDNREHKRAKVVSKIDVATKIHSKYKDVMLNSKCLRHSLNRTQSKDHGIGNNEINKISLPCFDDIICILNNEYNGLALSYQS